MSIEKTRAVNKQVKKQICSYETQHCVKRAMTIVHAPTFISRWKIVRKASVHDPDLKKQLQSK